MQLHAKESRSVYIQLLEIYFGQKKKKKEALCGRASLGMDNAAVDLEASSQKSFGFTAPACKNTIK